MKTEKEAIQDTIEYLKNTEPKCNCNQCRYYLNKTQCQQEQQSIKDKHKYWQTRLQYWLRRLNNAE